MLKSFLKFALIVVVAQDVTYFIAGIIAQLVLGASEFYPPSPHALDYLRDPHGISLLLILGAGALRGLLFALVLFPFREQILGWGRWNAAFAFGSIILVLSYVAASGGMIEHFVYFTEAGYPAKFAFITLVEVLIQTGLFGVLIVGMEQRFNRQAVHRVMAKPASAKADA